MTKKQLLLLSTLFMAGTSIAQISIDGTNLQTIGSTIINGYTNDSIPHTAAGPNQTWDFSNISNPNIDTTYILSPTGTPGASIFPNATMVITNSPNATGNSEYSYMKKTSNSLSLIGDIEGSLITESQNPVELLTFPLNYGTTGTDTFQFQVKGTGIELMQDSTIDSVIQVSSGSYSFNVDAWGTVTLPSGSYNVLRVFNTQIITINLYTKTSNVWSLYYSGTDTLYGSDYFSNTSYTPDPLVTQTLDKNLVVERGVSYLILSPSASINETNTINFSIFPNPTTSSLTINTDETLRNIVITDAKGNVVLQTSKTKTLNVQHLAKGIYTLTIQNAKGIATKQFIKQ